jgi:hypothetical protein
MNDIWLNMLEFLGQAWWAEIVTDNPGCTYYFGPFASEGEAHVAKAGYIEDLRHEGATNIRVTIKRCKPDPDNLTIYDEAEDGTSFRLNQFPILIS